MPSDPVRVVARMPTTLRLLLFAMLAGTTAGCATAPAPVPEIRPGLLQGYLGKELPDSLALLPQPPSGSEAAFMHDQEVSRASQRLKGSPRYVLASADADLTFPQVAGAFACALGVPITEKGAPYLYQVMRRVLTDAGLATYGAKNKYNRVRPFVHYNEATCKPDDDALLRKDGSYPSGHTSIGWAWALVLTELAPDRRDALLARGRSFGESRLVCNAHWQSDILEGRAVASGTVALLHSNAEFRSDMNAARHEIDAVRQRGDKVVQDCAAEAAALAIKIPGAL